jgi:hypothetical protein
LKDKDIIKEVCRSIGQDEKTTEMFIDKALGKNNEKKEVFQKVIKATPQTIDEWQNLFNAASTTIPSAFIPLIKKPDIPMKFRMAIIEHPKTTPDMLLEILKTVDLTKSELVEVMVNIPSGVQTCRNLFDNEITDFFQQKMNNNLYCKDMVSPFTEKNTELIETVFGSDIEHLPLSFIKNKIVVQSFLNELQDDETAMTAIQNNLSVPISLRNQAATQALVPIDLQYPTPTVAPLVSDILYESLFGETPSIKQELEIITAMKRFIALNTLSIDVIDKIIKNFKDDPDKLFETAKYNLLTAIATHTQNPRVLDDIFNNFKDKHPFISYWLSTNTAISRELGDKINKECISVFNGPKTPSMSLNKKTFFQNIYNNGLSPKDYDAMMNISTDNFSSEEKLQAQRLMALSPYVLHDRLEYLKNNSEPYIQQLSNIKGSNTAINSHYQGILLSIITSNGKKIQFVPRAENKYQLLIDTFNNFKNTPDATTEFKTTCENLIKSISDLQQSHKKYYETSLYDISIQYRKVDCMDIKLDEFKEPNLIFNEEKYKRQLDIKSFISEDYNDVKKAFSTFNTKELIAEKNKLIDDLMSLYQETDETGFYEKIDEYCEAFSRFDDIIKDRELEKGNITLWQHEENDIDR